MIEVAAAAVANVAGGLLARVAGQLEPVGRPPKGIEDGARDRPAGSRERS